MPPLFFVRGELKPREIFLKEDFKREDILLSWCSGGRGHYTLLVASKDFFKRGAKYYEPVITEAPRNPEAFFKMLRDYNLMLSDFRVRGSTIEVTVENEGAFIGKGGKTIKLISGYLDKHITICEHYIVIEKDSKFTLYRKDFKEFKEIKVLTDEEFSEIDEKYFKMDYRVSTQVGHYHYSPWVINQLSK